MTQRESRLSRNIAKDIRLYRGVWCMKIHGSEMQMAGVPDIIGTYRGRFFGFEVKLPESRGNVSKIQERVMELISSPGSEGHVAVICSIEEANAELDKLDAMIEQGR